MIHCNVTKVSLGDCRGRVFAVAGLITANLMDGDEWKTVYLPNVRRERVLTFTRAVP